MQIGDDERFTFERRFWTLSDLTRTPNQGIEYPVPERQVKGVDAFPKWLLRYVRQVVRPDWNAAWRAYDEAREPLWEIRATVVALERGRVRCDVEGGAMVQSREPAGRWGILERTHTVEIGDPQVLEALRSDMSVVLYVDLRGLRDLEDLRRAGGALPIALRFARIAE